MSRAEQRRSPSRGPGGPGDTGGYAITVALLIVVVALSAAGLLAGVLRQARWELHHEERALHLTTLCDAGVAQALARLSVDTGWTGERDQVLDRGTFDVWVDRVDAHHRAATVRCAYRTGRRSVEAIILLNPPSTPRVVRWRRVAEP